MVLSLPLSITECLSSISQILNKIGEWRVVGGAVRDIILNKKIEDIDIGIAATPEKVVNELQANGLKVLPTGVAHGTVTVLLKHNRKIEITSLRRDVSSDGRRATVEFTDNWREDAQRRDFTINAMSLDINGNIYDYFNGYKDLVEKRLSFVGNPRRRIEEDHLRVLRYWRFLATMDLSNLDKDSRDAAMDCFFMLEHISGERIQSEMLKLLSGSFAVDVVNKLSSAGLLKTIGIFYINEVMKFTSDPIVNLSMLIRKDVHSQTTANIDSISSRWKLSRAHAKLLNEICCSKVQIDWHAPLKEHLKYIYVLGIDIYKKLEMIARAEGVIDANVSDELNQYIRPRMPIRGNDVSFLKGRDVKEALQYAESYWIEKDFLPNKDDLLEYVKSKYRSNGYYS